MAWKDMKVMDDRTRRQRKKAEQIRQKIEAEKKLKEEIKRKTLLVSLVVMALFGLAIGFFIMMNYKEKRELDQSKNRAVIKDMKGSVQVKTEFKNFYVDIKKDEFIVEGTTVNVKDSAKAVIELADKTRIILYENSTLTFTTLSYNKKKKQLEVNLNLETGNAVFDIKKDHKKYEIHNLFVKSKPVSEGSVLFKIKSSKAKSKQEFVVRSGQVEVKDSTGVKKSVVSAGKKLEVGFKNSVVTFEDLKTCNIALEAWY